MDIIQLCTAYFPTCCVDIEDVNFSNISAVNTDRCFDIFAKNGASNVTFDKVKIIGGLRDVTQIF